MLLSACYYLGYISKVRANSPRAVIRLEGDSTEKYNALEMVLVQLSDKDETGIPFFIKHIHSLSGKDLTVDFDLGIQNSDSTFLKGKSIYLPVSKLEQPDENEFHLHEIIGFDVEDEEKGLIGKVSDVYEGTAHPVMAINSDSKEILIPIAGDILKKVDKEKKRIYIAAPEGLIDLYLA